jgi:hypothetical protein
MTFEGHNELYPALEAVLKEAKEPLDSSQIYDMPHIRAIAPSANRVSDYLSVLFRKGLVSRVAAESDGEGRRRNRWAYLWRKKDLPEWREPAEAQVYKPKTIIDRPNLYIAEDGEFINIDLPGFSITIKKTKTP